MKITITTKVFPIIFLFFLFNSGYARVVSSIASGAWESSATWVGGMAPTETDTVIINNGNIVHYNTYVAMEQGGSVIINAGGTLCGIDTFRIFCGGTFTCHGILSGTYIRVADGTVSPSGKVYAQYSFNNVPCSTGFTNAGTIVVGQPFSCTPTGVDQINFIAGSTIFPNPFTNTLNVTYSTNEDLDIILYDIANRKTLQQKISNTGSLNTEQLLKGIYMYELRRGNQLIKKGKIVKE